MFGLSLLTIIGVVALIVLGFLIKGVINEIAALDNPDLIKNNNKKEPGVKEPSSNVTDKKPTNYKDFASELKNDDSKKQIPFTRYKRGRKK